MSSMQRRRMIGIFGRLNGLSRKYSKPLYMQFYVHYTAITFSDSMEYKAQQARGYLMYTRLFQVYRKCVSKTPAKTEMGAR